MKIRVTLGAGLAMLIAASAFASDVPTRKDTMLISVTATVTAIDHKTREVTLKGPSGDTVTFIAGPEVKRLDEINVGDLVTADYYMSFVAELREPTAEEKEHPLEFTEVGGRAKEGEPAAGGVRQIKAVTTIEALNRPAQTVTVTGPLRRYLLTARVADPSRLEQLRIGQPIVITFTQAMAISVEKAAPKAQ
jgi:hypothetical protein